MAKDKKPKVETTDEVSVEVKVEAPPEKLVGVPAETSTRQVGEYFPDTSNAT